MEKIKRLRRLLTLMDIDGYIVPKNDEFFGEYTPESKDRLKYISNFSGSFGFALIMKNENFLFVDGRYTTQAVNECSKNFKIKTIPKENPKRVLKNKKLKIGFDNKLFTKRTIKYLFDSTKCQLIDLEINLIDRLWKRKKKNKLHKFFSLPLESIDHNYKKKVNKIIINLKNKKADYHFVTSNENVAWALNIRGKDSKYSPIPNSYILISKNGEIKFFCNLDKLSQKLRRKFNRIEFIDIELTSSILSNLKNKKIVIDSNTCALKFEKIIQKNNLIINDDNKIDYLKSIKSKKEIKNIKLSHIHDGVALTKFIFWLKNNYQKKNITEISAENKLLNFRKKNKNFKFLSFPTISGTGPNGAIVHYRATKESNLKLKKGNIYLIDSGGQYSYGTTDVTRTISLNNKSKRIKNIYTRILKGHIAVVCFKLNKNTSGFIIDKAARKFLKQVGLDYAHGTGHGVGYFLNVHEGPHAITKKNNVKFQKGMVVSNEPGYYEKNNFGIRIENLIYVDKLKKKLFFKDLTMVPIDKSLIDFSILDKMEKKWINNYHKKVFLNLKKFMNKSEVLELKEACSAI